MTDPNRPSGEALAGAHSASAVEPDPKRWLALAVLAAAQLMIVLDASIVNIALPSAQDDLGITNANRQWMVTAYTLAFGSLLLLGGRIADYTGRKRTFIIGLLGFAGASALGGFAPNQELLFAARALQGGFAALMAPAALSIVTVTFTDPKERAKAFGVFGALAGGGAAIGLIVGGVLTEYASWRWCLGVNVPVALIVAGFAFPLVHESKAHGDTRYDVPGVLLATLGLFSLVYGFTEAARAKNPSDPTDTSVQGWTRRVDGHASSSPAVVLLVAFVVVGDPGQEPDAAAARRPRPQPRWLVPDVPAGRCRAVRDVPVPHVLLPDQPGLQPAQVRLRLPAVQRGHHPDGRRGGAAAAHGSGPSRSWSRASSWRWPACCCSRRSRRTRRTGRTSCPPSCS